MWYLPKMIPKGKVPKAFIQDTDVSLRPFKPVDVDIVGPLNIASDKGNSCV